MHPIAMSIPRQPLMPDEFKHGGVDGHAEGLTPELGAEALTLLFVTAFWLGEVVWNRHRFWQFCVVCSTIKFNNPREPCPRRHTGRYPQ
jgi:hypothetical protein